MNIAEMHSWFDILQDKGDSPYFTTDEKTQFLNRAQMKFVNEHLNKFLLASGAQPEKNAVPYSNMESIQMGEDALGPLITSLQTGSNHVYTTLGHDGAFSPALSSASTFTEKQLNHYVQGMLKVRNSNSYNASTWKKTKMISILSVTWFVSNDDVNIRYVRHQDLLKIEKNAFKKPTVQDPVYTQRISNEDGRVWQVIPGIRPNNAGASDSSVANLWDDNGTPYTFADIPSANLNAVRLNITVIREPLEMFYDPATFEDYPSSANDNVSCELPDFTHDEIMAIALDDAGVASRDQALVQLNQASKSNITPQ